ncbi:MAG: hypothetical protein IPH36_11475 [Saprospiraceae bacterium]|nr:hypothetical protein [Saprospiraceae bacterium]
MKSSLLLLMIMGLTPLFTNNGIAQSYNKNVVHLEEDLDYLFKALKEDYVYAKDKAVDWACLQQYYRNQIDQIETEEDEVLMFEFLLDEFYDSHVILNSNRKKSYRLFAPLYVIQINHQFVIQSVWDEIQAAFHFNIIGARILSFNGKTVQQLIDEFPVYCVDKNVPEVKEWLINKALAGRYHEKRILEIQLSDGQIKKIDLDTSMPQKYTTLLDVKKQEDMGIIRIHNSLGQNDLVGQFDKALDQLMETEGLILDLRNTVDGGNSYVARGIMSRFISTSLPYQQHEYMEQYGQNPRVLRQWMEYVVPRGKTYTAPVVVLVGRWTGSMGEGLAVGLDGMDRAMVMGTEMERLAGEMEFMPFINRNYGFRISTAKLSHIDGTPREKYLPPHYVRESDNTGPGLIPDAISLLKKYIRDKKE